ncbi:MAG: rRNA adenine N(6)-methyltransferase family protein [Candidatus Shapirobacteria bacterium]|nr:rRNA adenine N(6)-methyltransferase family protein [Candidatus Shapirobacteria bacterium]
MTFSQNFIKSSVLVKQLLDSSSINQNDLVIEIGPGNGIITKELAIRSREVISVEKDRNLIINLNNKLNNFKNLKIYKQDFLTWSLPYLSFKIFSNIPFNITAQIVDKLLKNKNKAIEIYFIMQLEAAEKYVLTPDFNTQNSILLSIFYDAQILGNIDRTAFTPKPQVDIVFIKFTLLSKPLIDPHLYTQFRDFIIFGFNQWKSNVFEIYKKVFSYDQFKKINHQLKINSLNPSQLNIDQWLKLFDIYQKFVSENKKNLIDGFEKTYLKKIRVKNP